jgi:hypothetical protein
VQPHVSPPRNNKTLALVAGGLVLFLVVVVLARMGGMSKNPSAPEQATQVASPSSVVSEQGVTFRAADLEWQKQPAPNEMNWASAKSYCQGLALAGGGWRLPSKDELLALYATKASGTASFPGMDVGFYWSSSAVSGSSGYAWIVGFFGSSTTSSWATSTAFAVFAEDGPFRLFDSLTFCWVLFTPGVPLVSGQRCLDRSPEGAREAR